jgi:hypothetical protein
VVSRGLDTLELISLSTAEPKLRKKRWVSFTNVSLHTTEREREREYAREYERGCTREREAELNDHRSIVLVCRMKSRCVE